MPRLVKVSASTRNGLCSKIVSSRSWAPEPLIKMTAGKGPLPWGTVSVPARVIPAGSFLYFSSSTLYGNGGFGVCGRKSAVILSVFLRDSGSFAPA